MPSSSTSSWVDIPPGEDPAAAQGPQPTPRTKAKSGRLGSMMSALGRKGKEDPVKDLMALGYHEDDCRVLLCCFPAPLLLACRMAQLLPGLRAGWGSCEAYCRAGPCPAEPSIH